MSVKAVRAVEDTDILIAKTHELIRQTHLSDTGIDAIWELYVELSTRIVSQSLSPEFESEKDSLHSMYSLFPTTREILRKHGREAINIGRVWVPFLNGVIRPFTTKWHKKAGWEVRDFSKTADRDEFWNDFKEIQKSLVGLRQSLASILGISDADWVK